MAQKYDLIAEMREDQGKGASRRLRRQGLVPAIIYGAGRPPRNLAFDHNKVIKELENEAFYSSILSIKVGDKSQAAVVKDIQRHPAKRQILHMDFQRIVEDAKIRMNVPLHFIGEDVAPGVKQEGGSVSHLMTDVEVSCLPKDLPEYLEVDVAGLVGASPVGLRGQVRRVGLYHHPFRGDDRGPPPDRIARLVGDRSGEREGDAHLEEPLGPLRPAGPAVEHHPRTGTMLVEDLVDLSKCVPAMDDQWLGHLHSQPVMLQKALHLRLGRREVAVEVQTGLTDGYRSLHERQEPVPFGVPAVSLVRVQPGGVEGPSGRPASDLTGSHARCHIHPGHHHVTHMCRPVEKDGGGTGVHLEVAVRVNPFGHGARLATDQRSPDASNLRIRTAPTAP